MMELTTRLKLPLLAFMLMLLVTLNGCAYFGLSGIQRAARNGDIELAESALLKGASASLRDRIKTLRQKLVGRA